MISHSDLGSKCSDELLPLQFQSFCFCFAPGLGRNPLDFLAGRLLFCMADTGTLILDALFEIGKRLAFRLELHLHSFESQSFRAKSVMSPAEVDELQFLDLCLEG